VWMLSRVLHRSHLVIDGSIEFDTPTHDPDGAS